MIKPFQFPLETKPITTCVKCNEPGVLTGTDGHCYDCSVLCRVCREFPASPLTRICNDCELIHCTK